MRNRGFTEWFKTITLSALKGNKSAKWKIEVINQAITNCLEGCDEILFDVENGLMVKRTKDGIKAKLPVSYLSDGQRNIIGMVADIAYRCVLLNPYLELKATKQSAGIVLIDELDLHLHPKWQRELIDYLTNLFPNTQFIVTTHSPLIVQAAAARDANIVVCRREGDHVVIDQSLEAVRGWRADQILTSDLFDLPSTRDTEIEKLEREQRAILSKAKLTKADEKRAKEISQVLNSLRVMENPEDDEAMRIIRESAKYLQSNGRK